MKNLNTNEIENAIVKAQVEPNINDDEFKTKEAQSLIKCFCLSITYSATIGGTASLIGFHLYANKNSKNL